MLADGMVEVLGLLRPLVGKLAGEPLGSGEAVELVELCIEVERLAAAPRVMAAPAGGSGHWQGRGVPAPAGREGAAAAGLSAGLPQDEGPRLLAEVDARCSQMERDARAGGWYEGHDAHRADALVDLARIADSAGGAPAGPEAMVHVRVDYDA